MAAAVVAGRVWAGVMRRLSRESCSLRRGAVSSVVGCLTRAGFTVCSGSGTGVGWGSGGVVSGSGG